MWLASLNTYNQLQLRLLEDKIMTITCDRCLIIKQISVRPLVNSG